MHFIFALLSTIIWSTDATLLITSPLITPFPNNQIPYKYANFGLIDYHKSHTSKIIFLKHSLCNKSSAKHLKTPTYVVILQQQILKCSFAHQASVIESLGAQGVIFASSYTQLREEAVVLADDGNGRKVRIATLFINLSTWQKLINLTNVQISSRFSLPKAKISIVTVYLSASQRSGYHLMRRFRQQQSWLGHTYKLQPVYFTFNCSWCPESNCLLGKQYCSFDYTSYQTDAGTYIIQEQLRQYAIYQSLGQSSYLAYMSNYDDYCDYNWLKASNCHEIVNQKAHLKNVDIKDPFNTLNLWRKRSSDLNFDAFPEIAINGIILRGNFDPDNIIIDICQSLISPPGNCYSFQKGQKKNNQKLKKVHIGLVLFLCLLFGIVVGVICYKHYIKRQVTNDMTTKVNEIVADYANGISRRLKTRSIRQNQQLNEQL